MKVPILITTRTGERTTRLSSGRAAISARARSDGFKRKRTGLLTPSRTLQPVPLLLTALKSLLSLDGSSR